MMANRPDVTETGLGITQLNSLVSSVIKVYVPFMDTLPSTTVEDIIAESAFIDTAQSTDCQISQGDDSNSLNVGSLPPSNSVDGDPANWADPEGKDWLYFLVGRAKVDPGDSDSGYAIYLETNISENASLRVFPYMCRFRDNTEIPVVEVYCSDLNGNHSWQNNGGDEASGLGWECDYCAGWNLVEDQVYSIAAARRGDMLEHYFDGVLVGRVNVGNTDIATTWDSFDGGTGLELTHSGYTGSGCTADSPTGTVGHYPADFYGIAQFVFSTLPPQADLENAMAWMKAKMQTGDKPIWPRWVCLT